MQLIFVFKITIDLNENAFISIHNRKLIRHSQMKTKNCCCTTQTMQNWNPFSWN